MRVNVKLFGAVREQSGAKELSLELPEITPDLPTGASRLLQRGHGYRATICAGEITFRDGEPTGARPGTLVRGPR